MTYHLPPADIALLERAFSHMHLRHIDAHGRHDDGTPATLAPCQHCGERVACRECRALGGRGEQVDWIGEAR